MVPRLEKEFSPASPPEFVWTQAEWEKRAILFKMLCDVLPVLGNTIPGLLWVTAIDHTGERDGLEWPKEKKKSDLDTFLPSLTAFWEQIPCFL